MAKLKSDLTRIALKAPKLAAEALHKTGQDVIQLTKQLTPVDTGNLQRSYRVEEVSESKVTVGTDVEYAPFVEFGTSRQSAQPHFIPAFAQSAETFEQRLKQAFDKL